MLIKKRMDITKVDDIYEKIIDIKYIENPLSLFEKIVFNSAVGDTEMKLTPYVGLDHVQLQILTFDKDRMFYSDTTEEPKGVSVDIRLFDKYYDVMKERFAIEYLNKVYTLKTSGITSSKDINDQLYSQFNSETTDFEKLFSTKFSGLIFLKKTTTYIRQQ